MWCDCRSFVLIPWYTSPLRVHVRDFSVLTSSSASWHCPLTVNHLQIHCALASSRFKPGVRDYAVQSLRYTCATFQQKPKTDKPSITHPSTSSFSRRQRSSIIMAISDAAVVLFVILGAAAAVGLGWAATHRFFIPTGGSRDDVEPGRSEFSQAQYMREVRLRHQEDLAATQYGRSHYPMVGTHARQGQRAAAEQQQATPSAMESHGTLHYTMSPKVSVAGARSSSKDTDKRQE